MVVSALPSVHAELISGLCCYCERTTPVASIPPTARLEDDSANPAARASGLSEACQSRRRQVRVPFARRVLDENLPRAGADSSPRACAEQSHSPKTARRRLRQRVGGSAADHSPPVSSAAAAGGMRAARNLRTAFGRTRAARTRQASCAGLPRRRNHPHTVRSHYHTKSERQLRKSPRGRRCYDAATASR